ncbi:signal peptidase II [[Mycoplasma] mobile]|uniref:Lipoprotein signal peptidase n=1 Tax=Mycoplasma mobile (strain ATCC 43663 / 163K / NCTC 11711) TaxID=267748 RepID=Q6KHT9_MYCM1|nr:signal peptidase II [[Mycoplasma] mobile]AAT27839.1 lipoprotein signal peptidase [Mycoplasma mobile 163K]
MKNFIKKNNLDFWNINKKTVFKNLLTFLFLFTFLIAMDQIFKSIFFQVGERPFTGNRVIAFQWGIFGIYSLENEGLTSSIPLDSTGIQILSFFFLIPLSIAIIFSKNSFLTTSSILLFSGTLGNLMDRLIFGGKVKDIFFVGSINNGIFNFADIYVVVGSIFLLLLILWVGIFKDWVIKIISKKKYND